MGKEKNIKIEYNGTQISIFSDEKDDYVSITEMAKLSRGLKSIGSWLKNRQTLQYIEVWEKKHNPNFNSAEFGGIMKRLSDRNFSVSVRALTNKTNLKGIFVRSLKGGTYAHKDIAIRFAGWLNPEFELFLVEELQRLREIEKQKFSYDLLNHDQILSLIRLKEVFKYVAHQELVEDAHRDVYAAQSGSQNPFADFHKWRNEILNISPKVIDERIREYCDNHQVALTKTLLRKTKREKILLLDSYESVRNSVWDFLQLKGEINAINLANLVEAMLRTENGQVLRKNEDNLFEEKQNLGEYSDFEKNLSEMLLVKTAREVLELREEQKKKLLNSPFGNILKGVLSVPPIKNENKGEK